MRRALLWAIAVAMVFSGIPWTLTDAESLGPQDLRVMAQADNSETETTPNPGEIRSLSRDSLSTLKLDNIKPLYTSPALPGEGVWETSGVPRDSMGQPIIHKTYYRPSVDFPNAVVYMMVIDMSKTFAQYYVGSQEPAAPMAVSEVESELRPRILAVTNAMWMQRHSRGAGAIFRSKVLYPMVNGMASMIVYRDGSVDIQEWNSDIPVHMVRDARQLRHLIVKNGMVVQSVLRNGRMEDAEIGLGFLLGGGGKNLDGKHFWFVAHRSAFGIRKDGNLVFAIGHHIGTKDLAKALVLAGCDRGMHADANPHNIVANLYVRDPQGNLVAKQKLSPEQSKYTLKRYEDAYSKDFFAFFSREAGPANPNRSVSRTEHQSHFRTR
ncbi:MAG: hypothetical protein HY912_10410 [Desulfomonile tiedjei]|uniref:Phosphodiester glycosidase domain-containing protein n=1 Tax=Desulfomonile tiedjei TaxID=2358 RepID=A0A9D6V3D2_9BACT|nr:hypothetical protein [Desulfomonile tiedjei]